MAEKVARGSIYGNRRLICLLLAVASFFFLTITYMSVPRPQRDAMMAAVRQKAAQLHPQAPMAATPQQSLGVTSAAPQASGIFSPSWASGSAVFEAASNRSLGADRIAFLNLPYRHDRFDAIAIQAHLAGIQITRVPGFDTSTMQEAGMPPTENPAGLKAGEKGCWRAHANVWQQMLEQQIAAVVVLESDAGFDVNLRPIMGRLSGGFRQLLRRDNPGVALAEDPDDPWLARSGLWDLLSIGHCVDGRNDRDSYVIYDDPHAPRRGFKYAGIDTPLNAQRVVYRAKSIVCTTGYIVSLSGAARLLVRTNWNLEAPIDLIIAMMADAGELRAYSQQQPIVAQWKYLSGIKSGTDSDVHGVPDPKKKSAAEEQAAKKLAEEAWAQSKKTHSSARIDPNYEHTQFVDFALGRAWQHIIGE